jgi:hypothetical protein
MGATTYILQIDRSKRSPRAIRADKITMKIENKRSTLLQALRKDVVLTQFWHRDS